MERNILKFWTCPNCGACGEIKLAASGYQWSSTETVTEITPSGSVVTSDVTYETKEDDEQRYYCGRRGQTFTTDVDEMVQLILAGMDEHDRRGLCVRPQDMFADDEEEPRSDREEQ